MGSKGILQQFSLSGLLILNFAFSASRTMRSNLLLARMTLVIGNGDLVGPAAACALICAIYVRIPLASMSKGHPIWGALPWTAGGIQGPDQAPQQVVVSHGPLATIHWISQPILVILLIIDEISHVSTSTVGMVELQRLVPVLVPLQSQPLQRQGATSNKAGPVPFRLIPPSKWLLNCTAP